MGLASEKKILVVDDEPDVRNFLAACIEDAGFIVETAENGETALTKIKADPPDLMTLDMVMPRKSGIQLMRDLRRNAEWADIPVIVITAHARDEFGSNEIKDFNAFATRQQPKIIMEKPITPVKLVKSICDILSVESEADEKMKIGNETGQDVIEGMLKKATPETLKKIKEQLDKALQEN